jgi:hypothetical protein
MDTDMDTDTDIDMDRDTDIDMDRGMDIDMDRGMDMGMDRDMDTDGLCKGTWAWRRARTGTQRGSRTWTATRHGKLSVDDLSNVKQKIRELLYKHS